MSIAFDAATHTYTVTRASPGEAPVVVEKSTTALVHDNFEKFDAQAIVDKNYTKWKNTHDDRYSDIIAASSSDDAAKRDIIASWSAAAALGTKLHLCAEAIINSADMVTPPECAHEVGLVRRFLSSCGLTPWCAELPVWFETQSTVVSAGTVDALFKNEKNEYVVIDWKRAKNPLLHARSYRYGKDILGHIGDTPLNKYSLQLSVYAHMLKSSKNIDVGDRMMLVRVYPGMAEPEVVTAVDYRTEAGMLLENEFARLKRAGP